MKKILFITEKYPPQVNSGNRIYYLSKELSKKYDVSIIHRKNSRWLFPKPKDYSIPKIKKIKFIGYKVYDSILLIPKIILYKMRLIPHTHLHFNKIKKIIVKNVKYFQNFNLVICSGPPFKLYNAAEYLHDKFNIPFILDYRDPWISRTKKDLINQKRIINKASSVVTVTDFFAKEIKKITNYNKKINIIENGVDLSFFKNNYKQKINKQKIRIGYAGSFVPYQNIDILIKSVSKLPQEIKKNIVLEICGKYYSKKYINLAKKNKVNANFYGYLNLLEMNKTLNNCDLLYIGHSINSSVGGKLYTYLALNKPILCYTQKESQLDKEIKNNKLGFICYNIDQLSKTIENTYNNRKLLNNDNFKIEKYIKNYDWDILSEKYDILIKKTLTK